MSDLATRYATAEAVSPAKLKDLVDSAQVRPNWIRDTETFWYRDQRAGSAEYVLVDAEAAVKAPAFDHARLAEALTGVLDGEVDPTNLPITGIDVVAGGLLLTAQGNRVELRLDDYNVKVLGTSSPFEMVSPDGRWSVFTQEHDLHVRDTTTDEVRRLTTDGEPGLVYGGLPEFATVQLQKALGITFPPLVAFSADSKRLITARYDQRQVPLMHLVQSSPPGGGRPQLLSYHLGLVGDTVEQQATSEYFVFELESGAVTKADRAPDLTPFMPMVGYQRVWCSNDGSRAYVISGNRGETHVELVEIDAATGATRVVLEEKADSHITFGPQHMESNARTLSTGEVLWWSQRSGWGHLYLYGTDGSVRALTQGDWLVRKVVAVDEDARRVVFTAAGRLPGSDLYLQELASVSLDGGEITTITSDGLDHDVAPSVSGRFFVDVTSRYDVPTVSVLRDREGDVVLELSRADASRLYEAGWTAPERLVVKSADGVTDIYCTVHKPFDFDPAKKYAVLDDIYAGPQNSSAALRFPQSGGPMLGTSEAQVFAALGFVVVTVDGRGGAMRDKPFQDVCRVGDGAAFVDDHAAAIRQLAADRPWMDLARVGIMGHSAGGWASTRAILKRPDVFSVAVSSCGSHDNFLSHTWWGEKFYGLPEDFDYAAQSNAALAHQLEGKLLLVHGEMDDNAVAHGTMRVVDALITANKDFDLLIVPNAVHAGVLLSGYWVRRRWDYLVQHLMGETPPAGYRVADVPFPVP